MLVGIDSERGNEGLIYVDSNGNQQSCVPHLFWQQWISGEADATVGGHSLDLAPPAGLYLCSPNIPAENQLASLEYHVSAFLLSLRGAGTAHALRDAATGAIEKAHVEASFERRSDSSPLQVFHAEHELQEYVASLAGIQINQRIRVPRIISERLYWPPSDEAIERVNKLVEAGFTPSFQQIEGFDLGKAWTGFPQWAIQVAGKKGA